MAARDVHGLIDRCRRMDGAAWTEVYELIEQSSKRRIERRLQHIGIAEDRAEDVLHELYVYLRSEQGRRLGAFRGSTRRAFICFLRGVARRFTENYVRHWQRTAGREQQVDYPLRPPDRRGATMQEILAARLEFEASLNVRERKRWAVVLYTEGLAERPKGVTDSVPARTLSEWKQSLYRKYVRWIRHA
jgi:hypothetical protein